MDTTPTTVTCDQACTVTLSIQAQFPPFNLSESDGAQIGAAILLVWGLAFGIAAIVRTLRKTDGSSTGSED